MHPHDPQARIAKMKDGRTHLAHKLEQAADIDSGAIVAVTVQSLDGGDCASMPNTLDEAERQCGPWTCSPRSGGGQGLSQQRHDEGAEGARAAQ